MVNYLYESLCRYFNRLCHVGYMKEAEVEKLLVLTSIQRMVDCDFRGYLNEEDYDTINDALYNLYGTTCLAPYPDYYSNKDKRIMYTCSISELAHRISELENRPSGGGGGESVEIPDNLVLVTIEDTEEEIDAPDIE